MSRTEAKLLKHVARCSKEHRLLEPGEEHRLVAIELPPDLDRVLPGITGVPKLIV